jgi:GNAT superfamily N-acetyltransferase
MQTIDLSRLEFHPLDLKGVISLVSWAANEGWNPGSNDAFAFYDADPEGFFGYSLDGELIGGGAVVSYGGRFGFMGLFIVRPEYRSLGIGKKLWYQRRDLLLSRLQPGAPIGMDGVVAMQPFYAKGGFAMQFRSERHSRTGEKFPLHSAIELYDDDLFDQLLAYDTSCFGFPRPKFLKTWLELPNGWCFVYFEQNKVKGYANMRKVNPGHKIGPLFADTPQIAEALYQACLSAALGEEIFLDIPVVNVEAIAMAAKYQAKYVFECGRMYYGQPPELPLDKIFGITTFELG